MKIKTILVVTTLVLFSMNVFAQKQSAAETLNSFYKFHRSRSVIFNARELGLKKKWLTDELYKLFQNELKREKEYLKKNPTDKPHFGDGFPFQPYDECFKNNKSYPNRYEIGETTTEDNKTFVEVKFYNPKECGDTLIETYKAELVNTNGRWLINDWVYPDGTTLTQDLKRQEY